MFCSRCPTYVIRKIIQQPLFLVFLSGIRPDVVPGPSEGFDVVPSAAPTTFETFRGPGDQQPTPSSSSRHGSKPKHKRQDQVKQLSYNHSRYAAFLSFVRPSLFAIFPTITLLLESCFSRASPAILLLSYSRTTALVWVYVLIDMRLLFSNIGQSDSHYYLFIV